MSNDTSLDIRKVPVSELQTRQGCEVLGIFKEEHPQYLPCYVVARTKEGLSAFHTDVDGRLSVSKETCADIIRKKQLKGRVLYTQHGSYHISDDSWTEEDFVRECCTNSYPTASNPQFIRILTEVPELPTEEV
jgi:hypothetical protein